MKARIVILTLLVAGCGFLRRVPNQFYTLDVIEPAAAPTATAAATPLGIDGVELPPGFDRRGIVLRGEGGKFEVRGTHQWASPLEEMVIHTLAFDLANRLPPGSVILPGQAKPAAMRSISVTFADLAPGPDNVFVLDARWTIDGGGDGRSGHERITVPMTSNESPQIVAAMSSALATLAERIIAAV
jgi:uncharacterized lipoprotein YmbA